jgi:hypothetical protein
MKTLPGTIDMPMTAIAIAAWAALGLWGSVSLALGSVIGIRAPVLRLGVAVGLFLAVPFFAATLGSGPHFMTSLALFMAACILVTSTYLLFDSRRQLHNERSVT